MTNVVRMPSTAPEPIRLFGFVLTETGVTVPGKPPNIEAFSGALEAVRRMHHGSGLWLADLLLYAETRSDWAALIDAVIDSEQLTEGSVRQYVHVARAVPIERRVAGMGFGHCQKVASLPPEEQTAMLVQARDASWTVAELDHAIKTAKHGRILRGATSNVAEAEARVNDAAWLAAEACKAIPRNGFKSAQSQILKARHYLEQCEMNLALYRTLTEKTP